MYWIYRLYLQKLQMNTIYHAAVLTTLECGGVRTVVVDLDKYLSDKTDLKSVILTNEKEATDPFIQFKSEKYRFWNYAPGMTDYINAHKSDISVFHLHGVFMHAQYTCSRLAQRESIPYIVTPHGMLEPWHMRDKGLKKWVYMQVVLRELLQKSTLLHAITPLERDNLFAMTGHKNIVQIPNLMHLSSIPENLTHQPEEDYLLFLGRLHPKKGLDLMIKSLSKIDNKSIKVKVVGQESEHSIEMQQLAKSLGIAHRVEFLGSVYGAEKFRLYANARAFIAPSYSEAIGMVNLEAAVCKTPVVTTFETGIDPRWNENGGIMIHPTEPELTAALNQLMMWTASERRDRGAALSNFVADNYSWERKGHLWNDLYHSLLAT